MIHFSIMTKFKNPLKKYIYFWIDHFEFSVWSLKRDFFMYDELVWEIDKDNTPDWFIDIEWLIFKYDRINANWYWDWLKFETSIDWIPVSCFALVKWWDIKWLNNWAKSKDKVILYSSFFVLDSLNKLPFTLQEFVWLLFNYENALLYRLDLALDVPLTIKQLSPIFLDMQKPDSWIWTDKKHPEFYQTYYLWNPKNSENRHSLIRIYDKVLDTWKKHKWFLYPHLKNNKDVRRIELELRPEQAKVYHKYSILDLLQDKNNIINSIFSKYINKRIPEKYHLEIWSLKIKKFSKRKFDLKQAYLDYWHIPKDYLKHSYWYIKNVFHNTGYNWLFQLLFNQEHSDIFLQKNIKTSINQILQNRPYNLCIDSKTTINQNTNIKNWYDFLDHLIIHLKESWLQKQKINKILKSHLTKPKI